MAYPFTSTDVENYVRANFEQVEDVPHYEEIEVFLCDWFREDDPESFGDMTNEEMCWNAVVGENLATCGTHIHDRIMNWVHEKMQ